MECVPVSLNYVALEAEIVLQAVQKVLVISTGMVL
jgi:hypothetical protein